MYIIVRNGFMTTHTAYTIKLSMYSKLATSTARVGTFDKMYSNTLMNSNY